MWLLYSFVFAILSSIGVILAKHFMKKIDQYVYLFATSLFTIPILFAIAVKFFDFPVSFDKEFWIATVVGTFISVFAGVLAYTAIRKSELTIVNPISAFNPVFTAILAFFVFGESLGLSRIIGIALVVVGAYALQVSKSNKGFWKPIQSLVKHKGVRMSFVAYFLWAVSPLFEKTAIIHTFPQNVAFSAFVGQSIALVLFGILAFKNSGKDVLTILRKNVAIFFGLGILSGIGITAAFAAFSLHSLGITTAIFKTSLVFTAIIGGLLFKESDLKERVLGSIIMFAGVVFLTI